jgi:hypothetical protein
VGGIGVAEGSGVRVGVGVAAGVAPLHPLINHIVSINNVNKDLGLDIGLSPNNNRVVNASNSLVAMISIMGAARIDQNKRRNSSVTCVDHLTYSSTG